VNNAAPRALDVRAIGIGAAVGIGASLAVSLMWILFPMQNAAEHISLVILVSHAIGAAAGWLARVRGSVHGLFAGLIANIVSMGIGYAITLVRTDYGRTAEEVISYLATMLPWQVVGIALATLAGAIAVRFAQWKEIR
jgi:hypothetical protein